MNYKLPQHLPECNTKHQQFCASCRDMDGGRPFRETALKIRGVEGVEVDFDCPKGKPWGKQPLPKPPSKTDVRRAIARSKVCEPCEHNKGVKLAVVSGRGTEHIYRVKCKLCSTCGVGVSLVHGKCKDGKWERGWLIPYRQHSKQKHDHSAHGGQ